MVQKWNPIDLQIQEFLYETHQPNVELFFKIHTTDGKRERNILTNFQEGVTCKEMDARECCLMT